ncbi:MAG: transporter substrate-binding domain-containing protein [Desulfobacteraceae bacterium]|nr:transporter substrate-binding domain-containing protein [Desulfobacteraceae bacterium]
MYCKFYFLPLIIYTIINLLFCSVTTALEFNQEELDFLEKKPIIRVHNETDWPPFNFYENGKPQGISIDVMNRISEISGLKIEYVTGPSWDEFIKMMGEKKLDVMLNIVDIPERRDLLRFTTSYAKSLTGVLVKKENQKKFFNLKDMADKTIAVPAGFDLEINLPKYHPDIRTMPVRDILECIDMVHSRKADGFIEEIGVADYIMSQRMITDIRLAFHISEDPFITSLSIATLKENKILFNVIQKSLNAISDEELHSIRKKWLLDTAEIYEKSMVNLTVKEKEYLYLNNQINICVDPSWPPLDFIDDNGVHSGLSADLINLLSKRTGFKLNLIPTDTWDQSLEFISNGRCQVIPLMNETSESKSFIDFTQPYFNFATVIAARNDAAFIADYSELYGKTIALQAHFFITEYVKKNHPDINIIEVENTREALKLVSEQKAFATIDSLPTIINTIEAHALENIKIAGSVPQENQMKTGVRKGNDILLSILNKGINSLSEQEKINLYKKWFDIEVANQFFNKDFLLKAFIVACVVFIFLIWRQISLRRYAKKLKILNEKLRYAATYDHLTGIFNRKSIEKRLEIENQKSVILGEPLSLVIMDIDYFKSINDFYGHIKGDMVLKELADFVQKSIRKTDHFGRWGGEEFLMVLPNTRHQDAFKIMNTLKENIENHDFGLEKPVTVSMGVGQLKQREKTGVFLTRVDNSLYAAKKEGRNRVVNAGIS